MTTSKHDIDNLPKNTQLAILARMDAGTRDRLALAFAGVMERGSLYDFLVPYTITDRAFTEVLERDFQIVL